MIPRDGGDNDVIAMGMQECTYTSHKESKAVKKAQYFGGTERSVHNFFGALVEHLGDQWEPLESAEAWEMRLIVFVRKKHRDQIHDVAYKTENTGIAGVVPNKGGLVVRFMVAGTSVAFVSCHLEAHEGAGHRQARNNNCEEVMNGARVGWSKADVSFLLLFVDCGSNEGCR